MVVKEGENLLEMSNVHCVHLLASLWQCDLRLGVAVCIVEDIAQLPENTAEAVYKPLIVSFEGGKRLLRFRRPSRWFLQEYPTQLPYLLGQRQESLIVLGLAACLDLPAGGEEGFFEVPPAMLGCMEMVGLQARMRPYRFDRFGEAVGVIREDRSDIEAEVFDVLQKFPGVLSM